MPVNIIKIFWKTKVNIEEAKAIFLLHHLRS